MSNIEQPTQIHIHTSKHCLIFMQSLNLQNACYHLRAIPGFQVNFFGNSKKIKSASSNGFQAIQSMDKMRRVNFADHRYDTEA